MRVLSLLIAIVAMFTFAACDRKPSLDSDKAKYSYAMGHRIARNMKNQNVDLDIKAFALAVNEIYDEKEASLKEDDMQKALRAMAEQRSQSRQKDASANTKKGEDFLAANKSKEGVQSTPSGLQYKVLTAGDGQKPKAEDRVEVNYKGTLIDGTEFDSSYKRGKPATFAVKGVIEGWQEGLQLMKTGSKYEFVIPSALAYGERGNPSIPPNSVLVFEVELIKIVK